MKVKIGLNRYFRTPGSNRYERQGKINPKILQEPPEDWDMLFIGRSKFLDGVKVAPNIIKPNPVHKRLTNHGMFAYLIKTSSIPKLLKIMLPIPVYYQHIDWKLRAYYSKGINAYYLEKPLVMHNYKIESIREQGLHRNKYNKHYKYQRKYR